MSVTDPDGNTTSYVFDDLNRPIETIDPLHNTSFDVYDLDGNVILSTDADGRTTQFVFDPLGQQVQENWLSSSGSIIHTIHTYYDADGETVGVTETDTNNPANCTNYEYTYDADGSVLTSRMAPGDLAARRPLLRSSRGCLRTPARSIGTARPTPAPSIHSPGRRAARCVLTLDSPAFDAALVVQPPGGGPNSWIIDNNSGGGTNAYLLVPVGETGVWTVWVTSPSAAPRAPIASRCSTTPIPSFPRP